MGELNKGAQTGKHAHAQTSRVTQATTGLGLQWLKLRDFVIVHEAEITLAAGFTVLTGETGAGKSILIDALQLLLGARAESGVVRQGAKRAEISAEFALSAPAAQWLQEAGMDDSLEDEGKQTVLLRRQVEADGKSRAWINASPCTATQLRDFAPLLLEIHGQHAWQNLGKPSHTLQLLDAFGQIDASALRECWQQYKLAQEALDTAQSQASDIQSRQEQLLWKIGELDKLSPQLDEWGELEQRHKRLTHAHSLKAAALGALELLEDEHLGVALRLSRTQQVLAQQASLEPEFSSYTQILADAASQLEDVAHSLRAYARRVEIDEDALGEVDARMSLWISLAKRFRLEPQELAHWYLQLQEQLEAMQKAQDTQELQQQLNEKWQKYQALALSVAQLRKTAAVKLSEQVSAAMQQLGMQGGSFICQVQDTSKPTAQGMQDVQFLFAAHGGSEPKPLAKVASGGELSRIALAITVCTSAVGQAQTLIFDEVDAGIGGQVALTVGNLLQQIGAQRQVLVITHLPQVAAKANQHILISKHTVNSGADVQTRSEVQTLETSERVAEIARMLGAKASDQAAVLHAKQLLGIPPNNNTH